MDKIENAGPDDSAAVLLRSAEDGELMHAFGRELRSAIVALKRQAAMSNMRKKGTVTLKLSLVHDPGIVLESEAEIAVKLPKERRAISVHFTDDDGDISNRRPEKQITIEAVEGGKTNHAKAKPNSNVKAV